MSMTRSEKEASVKFLTDEFNNNDAFVVCDYKGLKVNELEALRVDAKENDIKVKVVKNNLASIALKNSNKEDLVLNDTNLMVWGSSAITIAKTVFRFKKDHENLAVKSGYFEGKTVDPSVIQEFSKLPDREELLGMLASVWMGPIRNFTIGLNQLKVKKETEN